MYEQEQEQRKILPEIPPKRMNWSMKLTITMKLMRILELHLVEEEYARASKDLIKLSLTLAFVWELPSTLRHKDLFTKHVT